MYKSIEILNTILDENLELNSIIYENQNEEYEGIAFPNLGIRSRLAKRTPKKKGYFVASYVAKEGIKNRPYTSDESLDYLAICISDSEHEGAFMFPKQMLVSKGILTTDKLGKMAFRVYPPFEMDLNATATLTQTWQSRYYHNILPLS